jgi:hypothetical protein
MSASVRLSTIVMLGAGSIILAEPIDSQFRRLLCAILGVASSRERGRPACGPRQVSSRSDWWLCPRVDVDGGIRLVSHS